MKTMRIAVLGILFLALSAISANAQDMDQN